MFMEIKELNTEVLDDMVGRIEDIGELQENLNTILAYQNEQWPAEIKRILAIVKKNGCNQEQLAKYLKKTRQTINKWTNGSTPREREIFIKLALAAGFDIEETNAFINKYGHRGKLYSKNLEDCVVIYVINKYNEEKKKGHDMAIDERFKLYNKLLDRFKSDITEELTVTGQTIKTYVIDEELNKADSEEKLERFVNENRPQFSKQFHRLYAQIKADDCGLLFGDYGILSTDEENRCPASLKNYVRQIKNKSWYPDRNSLIKLGLYMNLTHEQIDELLELAKMGRLYTGNVEEAMIIYALDNAELNNIIGPDSVDMQEDYDPYYLMNYVDKVREEINNSEIDKYIEEFFKEKEKDEEREIEL